MPSTTAISSLTPKLCVVKLGMKREAYGFTDDCNFELRLLALHDAGITSFL